MGAILYQITSGATIPIAEQVRFATAAAALCATKKGGIPAMPSKQLVEDLLRQ
jgi:sugar/nucleoside kinase (ribokinase family)